MVQRTFVSYHEIVILAIIWSDYLIKLLFTTYFNKYVIYVLAILMATTFLNPNSRNGAFLAFFLYLPTYLVCIIPGSAEVYEGRDVSLTGPFIPEYGYPLILCPIIGTALMIYMGRYMELEPSGPYGVGHSYKPVIEDDFYMNCIVFYPVKKSEYDGYKYHIRQNLKWFQPGSDGISTQAKDNGLNPILMHELLTYRIYSVEDRKLQKDFLAKHKKLTPVIVSHGITHWCTSLSAYILELVSHGCIVFTVDHTDGSCIGYKDFSKDPEEFVPYASHSEQTELSQTQYHEKQLKTRMKDVEYLLKFIKEEFKEEPWDIDFDNLVALGHSFGATSAMEMCKTFPDAFKY